MVRPELALFLIWFLVLLAIIYYLSKDNTMLLKEVPDTSGSSHTISRSDLRRSAENMIYRDHTQFVQWSDLSQTK